MSRRSAILLACLGSACVGLPPGPPQQDDGTATDDGPGTTAGITTGVVTLGTADEGTGSGTEDTGMPSPSCGDGVVAAPEECDLGDLNGTGMYCTSDCRGNVCGDGYLGPGEACDDGNDSNADRCTTLCGPTTCGDGRVQGAEQCDDGKANAETAACLPSCVMATCGDLFVLAGVEICDGTTVGEATCESQGYTGGVLSCASDCATFDTSSCYACGNGVIDPGETCDGTSVGEATCESEGYTGGVLACDPACASLDPSGCTTCGNALLEVGEECEPEDLGGATCTSVLGDAYRGALACAPGCTLDTAGCCLVADNACVMDDECCSGSCNAGTMLCEP